MALPRQFELAKKYCGNTKEIKGSKHNPSIVEMFETVGHSWVESDEVAWCAAFLGTCFEKVGIRSTRALNARSYENWGIEVSNKDINIDDAKPGDVVVLWRQDPKSWKGHVAFYDKHDKKYVYILGGNQRDEVSIAKYPRDRIVTIRRAGDTEKNVRMPLSVIQQKLKDLGYNPGVIDGLMGPNTRAAILSFKDDNGLKLTPIINKEFETKLENPLTKKREISTARKSGKPLKSRILNNSNKTMALGGLGGLLTVGSQIAEALNKVTDKVDEVQGIVENTVDNIQNKASDRVEELKEQASDTVADLKDRVDEVQVQASDKVAEIKEQADAAVDSATDAVKDNVGDIIETAQRFQWLTNNLDTILFSATVIIFGSIVLYGWLSRKARISDYRENRTL